MVINFAPPDQFAPKFTVVSCYVQYSGKLLLLLRNADKSEGDKWGAPAGKVDAGEDIATAIAREVAEETGIVAPVSSFVFLRTAYIRYPEYDYIFHIYGLTLDAAHDVTTNPGEHQAHAWATPEDALAMPLVKGNVELINHFFRKP